MRGRVQVASCVRTAALVLGSSALALVGERIWMALHGVAL